MPPGPRWCRRCGSYGTIAPEAVMEGKAYPNYDLFGAAFAIKEMFLGRQFSHSG